jgi:hypothetical protein
MKCRIFFRGALPILGLAVLLDGSATAQPSDSLAAASLRLALGARPWARVSSPWCTARLSRPRVTAAGLAFAAARSSEPGSDLAALPNPIPFAQVYRVEVPVSSAGSGVVFGGLVGATIGALGGLAVASMPPVFAPSREPAGNRSGTIAIGALLGAVPGALLGAAVGSAFHDLKQVYPRDPRLDGRVR